MTNIQEREFRNFLEGVLYHGKPLTESGINTRVARCKQAELIVKMDVEAIVSTDAKMRQKLLELRASDEHGGRANAVRKYYEMRRGKAFPRLIDAK